MNTYIKGQISARLVTSTETVVDHEILKVGLLALTICEKHTAKVLSCSPMKAFK